jgi:chorismate lyase/3-hydroxybenzoate synthase
MLLQSRWHAKRLVAKIGDMSKTYPAFTERSVGGLGLPSWVDDLLGPNRTPTNLVKDPASPANITLSNRQGAEYVLISSVVSDSTSLTAQEFEKSVEQAYLGIGQQLRALGNKQSVRFWNFIPSIHEPMGDDLDRYMVFNAGRFNAFAQWYALDPRKSELLPTATGVGHTDQDLVIHCLAGNEPGAAVENPRQRPAYRYSQRFGPIPPCFARATVLPHKENFPPLILVGGTASVCGEESQHIDNPEAQVQETLENLSSLLAQAQLGSNGFAGLTTGLDQMTEARVYYKHQSDAAAIEAMVRNAFKSTAKIEMFQAELCRQDLLVEIEGIAQIRTSAQ